ncbi:hypothetical protein Tco_0161340, partial [Tanacetum coccineum]
ALKNILDKMMDQEKEATKQLDADTAEVQNTGIFCSAYNDEDLDTYNSPYADQVIGAEADFNNMEPSNVVIPIPITRLHSIHPKNQIIRDPSNARRVASVQDSEGLDTS